MNRTWFYSMLVRVIATIAETALGVIGTATILYQVDWALVFYSSLLSGIVCFLRCLTGLPEVDLK